MTSRQGDFPKLGRRAVVFAACNDRYFESFAAGLADSLRQSNPDLALHLHSYEPSPSVLGRLNEMRAADSRFSFTWEDGSLNHQRFDPGLYYASARFTVLPSLAKAAACTIVALDIDSLVRASLDSWLTEMDSHDLGLFIRPGRKPWRKIQASSVIVRPSERGLKYVTAVGATVAAAISQAPAFHVDQMALWYQYLLSTFRRPDILKLDSRFLDWSESEESVVWTAKGSVRKEALIGTRDQSS